MVINLVKVDYHDIGNGSLYYIKTSDGKKRESISKDTFNQILAASKSHSINSYPWESCTTNDYFLSFD